MQDLMGIYEQVVSKMSDPDCRYWGWVKCYDAFGDAFEKKTDVNVSELCGILHEYLGKMGMKHCGKKKSFVGAFPSSVHASAINTLLKGNYRCLRGIDPSVFLNENSAESQLLKTLVKELKENYEDAARQLWNRDGKCPTATDTLLSKVILGVLACDIGLDSKVKKALKVSGIKFSFDSERIPNTMKELANIYNKKEIASIFSKCLLSKDQDRNYYKPFLMHPTTENLKFPPFRLFDIILWQTGKDNLRF